MTSESKQSFSMMASGTSSGVFHILANLPLLTICQVLVKSALLMKTTAILNGSANETLLTKVIRSRPFASA